MSTNRLNSKTLIKS